MIVSKQEVIEELKDLLINKKLNVFAGSGVSVDSEIPTWDGIIESFLEMAKGLELTDEKLERELEELIEDAEKSINEKKNDNIRIATVIKSKIKEINFSESKVASQQFDSWVGNNFGEKKKPNEYHEFITNTAYPFILTSNYDLLFERAAYKSNFKKLHKNSFTFKEELKIMSSIVNQESCIIHVHGASHDLDIDEVIFTKDDYNKIILKKYNGFSFALRMLFTQYSTLFVGYGASDPHLEEILEELASYFPETKGENITLPTSYLILKKNKIDSILSVYKERIRVKIIAVENFEEVKELLQELQNINPRKHEESYESLGSR